MRTYNALFILPPSLRDEELDRAIEGVQAEIVKVGGEVRESQVVGKRGFARPIHKQFDGLYVRMALGLDPEKITPLLARFKLSESIERVQIVRAEEKRKKEKQEAVPEEESNPSETTGEEAAPAEVTKDG